jgi:hypothetical protein
VDGYPGQFFLATVVEAHPAETLVRVTVLERQPSRLVLHFSDEEQVVADARVLLCGHIGAQELLQLGYTGPLATRPELVDPSRSKASRPAPTA